MPEALRVSNQQYSIIFVIYNFIITGYFPTRMDCNYIMYFTPSDEKEGLPQTQAILCEYFLFFLVATRILTNFTRTLRTK